MNLFTKHPSNLGETYLQHMKFAVTIAGRMLVSSAFFLTHGVMPFINIPSIYNLESMFNFLKEKNEKRS